MTLVLAIFAVGALAGAALAFPVGYALGGEHAHRDTRDHFRTVRNARSKQ